MDPTAGAAEGMRKAQALQPGDALQAKPGPPARRALHPGAAKKDLGKDAGTGRTDSRPARPAPVLRDPVYVSTRFRMCSYRV